MVTDNCWRLTIQFNYVLTDLSDGLSDDRLSVAWVSADAVLSGEVIMPVVG